MALGLDGFMILRSIGANRDAFRDIASEVTKNARALVVKQLKTKSGGLTSVREVCRALGEEAFSLIVDGMTDAEIKTLVTRLDKHHPELKGSNAYWRRNHLRSLAAGATNPSPKLEKPKKARSSKAPKGLKKTQTADSLWSEAMAAVRERK